MSAQRNDVEGPGRRTAADVPEFGVLGELPLGTTLLEASAGTGKTWTIAALVTRYVAEGVAELDRLLVVTFGRAATSELRSRVRERLREVADALEAHGSGHLDATAHPDPVVAHLARAEKGEVAQRVRRLRRALAGFDAATVTTTHGFCEQVLRSLGTAADLDPGTLLEEDLRDLVREVADDLLLRWHMSGQPSFADPAQARALAAAVADTPDSLLLPLPDPPREPRRDAQDGPQAHDVEPGLRARYAAAVRAELDKRKRALRLMGYDDLLLRVRDALVDPVAGPTAQQRLRDRYAVVLVDEFQDTDPVQWDVLREAFHGHRPLVLIGDPKQSIYAFRGADVHAYLDAAHAATLHRTLGTSFRGDPHLVTGLAALLRGAALGDRDIVVRPVAAGRAEAALVGPDGSPDPTPVRVRHLPRGLVPDRHLTQKKDVVAAWGDARVAADVADQVAGALQEGLRVRDGEHPAGRPFRPGDVAVLVRNRRQAALVGDALRARGIACVSTRSSDVFDTEAAHAWLVLLQALELPHQVRRVRRLALSPWVGWDAQRLVGEGDTGVDRLAERLRGWVEAFEERGVGALLPAVAASEDLWGRVLARTDGERLATDLRHVAEALHAQAREARLGISGLVGWLQERVAEAGGEDQERARRLETDASAVQVLTVHASKGLEFAMVCVPFAWKAPQGKAPAHPRLHVPDPDGRTRRALFVGGPKAGKASRDAGAEHLREEAAEELRLLYVAATRAIGRLVVWWLPGHDGGRAPLTRLLYAADPGDLPASVPSPTDAAAAEALGALARAGGLAVQQVPVAALPQLAAPSGPAGGAGGTDEVRERAFDRGLDLSWRRTSYSGLTRALHEQTGGGVGSEPESPGRGDETDADDAAVLLPGPEAAGLLEVASPMADLPSGAAFGVVVHSVLETADLAAHPDGPRAALAEAAAVVGVRGLADGLTPDVLAAALEPAVLTPLGPLADHRPFASFASSDVLSELEFELPLAGGDEPTGRRVLLGEVAALLRDHLPADDPVLPYAPALEGPELARQPLRGYLTGSIDALLRVAAPGSGRRFVVVDHKTNRLAPPGQPLTAWHYRPEALDAEVRAAHYPLQAMLYCVATHRFLRWRISSYDPSEHLGGVLYLFLRGMCGPATGAAAGVWQWRPPAALIVALSDLLAGEAR
ncbi:MAG: UvrD-helicase domain-containing protein [Motilibacteraceae bacterium]